MDTGPRHRFLAWLWVAVFVAGLVASGIRPKDHATWVLEVAPAVAVFVLLIITRSRFPLTPLSYGLILFHCLVLMLGGHYTYAEVPAGDWVRDLVGGERNNYDKFAHVLQGFVPAVVAREILVRLGVIARPGWLAPIVICICLAISAFYELIEWWVALLSGEAADAFLGTQGYVWDTQSDMFMALLGAIAALALLSGVQDRQIRRLDKS